MMRASGQLAEIKVGYQPAVTIADWSFTSDAATLGGPTTTITGRVAKLDRFWSTQGGMRIGMWMGQCWWVWDVTNHSGFVKGTTSSVIVQGNPVIVERF